MYQTQKPTLLVFGYPGTRPGTKAAFPKVRLVILIEAGTDLIVDALMCPYRMGERVRALKLLRSVTSGMLLMWDRGLHSYAMVHATLARQCHYLGRVPANIKFSVEKVLEDGSYLSWIAPDRKSKTEGAAKIQLRVIEYSIDSEGEQQTFRAYYQFDRYRAVSRLVAGGRIPSAMCVVENTIDELKTHLSSRKTPIRSKNPREVVQEV